MNEPDNRSLEERVLVLDPDAAAAEISRSLLVEAGLSVKLCADLADLCQSVKAGAGAILVAEEIRGASEANLLIEELGRQPPWSDVPVLVLANDGADSPAAAWAMQHLGNVTVLERPVRSSLLINAVRSGLRGRRRQYELRDTLEEVRTNEERYRLAAEAVNGLIYEQDLRTGAVERSRGLYEVLGYHPNEVPATDQWWFQQIHPDDQLWLAGWKPPAGQPTCLVQYRVRHKDGRWLNVTDHALIVHDASGQPCKIVGFTVDVTEQKRAEALLERSEAEYRSLFEMAGVGNAEIELESGRFVRVNRRYCEMLGYTAAELLGGMTFLEVTHPDDRDWNLQVLTPFLRDEQERFEIEKRYVRKDGTVVWIHLTGTLIRDASGRPIRVLSNALDISDRKRAEEALRARTAQLDFALASTGVGMWLNTMPLGRLNWDKRTRELFFIPPDVEPSVELFYSRLHPDDREPTRQAVEAALRDRTLYAIDHRAVHPETGEIRWIRSAGRATYGPDGSPTRFDGINYDITDRKRLEEELRQAVAGLAEADRRKDEFLATLAHELRNPLAPMRNAIEILHLTGPSSHDLAWAADLMDRQIRQMTRLIDDLLDLSRITRGKLEIRRERVELSKVIAAAVETCRPLLERKAHKWTVVLPPGPIVLDADLTRLSQAFSNLLTNAAKYTDPGGRILLEARRVDDEIQVEVTDNGIGIPVDKLSSLFKMFSQVEGSLSRSQGGLGIGLCLVKQLVELHGGRIEAHSEGPGRGSRFLVRLPFVDLGETPSNGCDVKSSPAERPPLRVLVVDDNVDAANSLARVLQSLGDRIRIAHDGVTAVQAAAEFRPDLVLLDLGLPGLNGYEACQRIRQQPWGKDMAIIAVTGWGQEEDRRRSQVSGFNHHLVKPVDPQVLLRLLDDLGTVRV